MYKILIIGHGEFPHGIKSSFEMLTDTTDELVVVSLTAGLDFAEFEKQLKAILITNDQWLILSDFLGGSPMQTAAKAMNELNLNTSLLVSGFNMAFLLETYFSLQQELSFDQVKELVANSLTKSQEMMNILDINSFRKET